MDWRLGTSVVGDLGDSRTIIAIASETINLFSCSMAACAKSAVSTFWMVLNSNSSEDEAERGATASFTVSLVLSSSFGVFTSTSSASSIFSDASIASFIFIVTNSFNFSDNSSVGCAFLEIPVRKAKHAASSSPRASATLHFFNQNTD